MLEMAPSSVSRVQSQRGTVDSSKYRCIFHGLRNAVDIGQLVSNSLHDLDRLRLPNHSLAYRASFVHVASLGSQNQAALFHRTSLQLHQRLSWQLDGESSASSVVRFAARLFEINGKIVSLGR
jgi:hypothetical protein